MVEAFEILQIWQADSLALPDFDDATIKFENDDQIKLDYCIPQLWAKKRTETTGVQDEQDVHPDTGPAGGFVEIQFTADRSTPLTQNFLSVLLKWYGTQNTNSDFKRGFLGLINTDNPQLDITEPQAFLGYRLVQFQQINPLEFPARQIFRIQLQFGGKAINLPNLS